jgi:hypothetical protein
MAPPKQLRTPLSSQQTSAAANNATDQASISTEATMSGTRKVGVRPLSRRGAFLVLIGKDLHAWVMYTDTWHKPNRKETQIE